MPGDLRFFYFFLPAHPIPVMRQLLDVMDEAEELPLRINLLLTSKGEAIELLVMPDIPEHRFNRRKASPIQRPTFRTIDRPFHEIGVAHVR